MTREEAIQILSTRDAHGVLCGYTSGVTEALDMAIEALSAEAGWIPCDGKLPNKVGDHVLVTIKWADDDLEVCEMCPTSASRYNIVAYQKMPTPYKGGDAE